MMKSTFKDWYLILGFAIAKLLVHFLTCTNYELHRDAYLYHAQSEHLAWGYISVPPTIAFIGKISTLIFGNTVFGLRFFPALIGALNLVIIGLVVRELGGKKVAIILASFAYLLSPAYLHTNALFQPVSFNHFYWLLLSFLILVMINRNDPKYWIWIGLVIGFGFLNKYSIVFISAALGISLLLTPYRNLYKSRYFMLAVGITTVVVMPNLIWQYQNNWPVLQHMAELRETQLVHVRYSDFFVSQLLMNVHAILLWVGALVILLFYKQEKPFRLFGIMYLVIILLLVGGSGKGYYSLGIYPILFVFGAYFIEKYVKRYIYPLTIILILSMGMAFYGSLSFDGIPFIRAENAVNKNAFRWEDGVDHDISQDMADMTGWKEIGETARDIYRSLSPENALNCDIYADHYGQAGAVMFFGKEVGIPQPISTNGSFVFWAPDSLSKEYMIYIHYDRDHRVDPELRLAELFEEFTLIKTIDNKYFREKGTRIYLCRFPNNYCKDFYKTMIKNKKDQYR